MSKYVDTSNLKLKTNYHDRYGKKVVKRAAGSYFSSEMSSLFVKYRGMRGRIDGTVGSLVAVEIEAKTEVYAKQVRGAVLDLICHSYPKKLLVLIPVGGQAAKIAEQSRSILEKFVDPSGFRVVVLNGTGDNPDLERDALRVGGALRELGWERFPVPGDRNDG